MKTKLKDGKKSLKERKAPMSVSEKRKSKALSNKKTYKKRGEAYKATKRLKYKNDEEYRQSVLEAQRARYKKSAPDYKEKSYGENRGEASNFAVDVGDGLRGLGVTVMAEFLGVSRGVFIGWVKDGKFPNPQKTLGKYKYYTIEQADRLAEVLNTKLKGVTLFNKKYTEVILSLREAM